MTATSGAFTAGIDVGSTYTKVAVADSRRRMVGHAVGSTGFRPAIVAGRLYEEALADAGLTADQIGYVVATGYGRHQVPLCDIHVTDLTASARGVTAWFPHIRTVLDIGGQTMKASGLDEAARVKTFRLNDKCAAGTGAFLEKTARYMGYSTAEIGPLMATSKESVPISGVCAVFAESEVINHLSLGAAPADIMQGALESLVGRAVGLLRRVKLEPDIALIGGVMRFPAIGDLVRARLGMPVHVPDGERVHLATALGAAILGQIRLERLRGQGARVQAD